MPAAYGLIGRPRDAWLRGHARTASCRTHDPLVVAEAVATLLRRRVAGIQASQRMTRVRGRTLRVIAGEDIINETERRSGYGPRSYPAHCWRSCCVRRGALQAKGRDGSEVMVWLTPCSTLHRPRCQLVGPALDVVGTGVGSDREHFRRCRPWSPQPRGAGHQA